MRVAEFLKQERQAQRQQSPGTALTRVEEPGLVNRTLRTLPQLMPYGRTMPVTPGLTPFPNREQPAPRRIIPPQGAVVALKRSAKTPAVFREFERIFNLPEGEAEEYLKR